MTKKLIFILTIIFIAIVLALNSDFVVNEGQQAVVSRAGKVLLNANGEPGILEPGLHAKVPLLDTVAWFDLRLQTATFEHVHVITQQQQDVFITGYVQWQITDLAQYLRISKDMQVDILLKRLVSDAVRSELGKYSTATIVLDAPSTLAAAVTKMVNSHVLLSGITVLDVGIKTIDLPQAASAAIIARMRDQGIQLAAKRQAAGQAKAAAIRAKADTNAALMIATAKVQAATIMAQGDREAAKLYNDNYHQDPEFYAFYRSLAAYRHSFSHANDVILLDANSDFFTYFKHASMTARHVAKSKASPLKN